MCQFIGCKRVVTAKGLCTTHYQQQRRGKALKTSIGHLDNTGVCPIKNCRSKSHRQSLCATHYNAKLRYKLSNEQLNKLFEKPECYICDSVDAKLHIDHDHACCPGTYTCGKCVRGLLCGPCNVRLGYVESTEEWLEKAKNYLTGSYVL